MAWTIGSCAAATSRLASVLLLAIALLAPCAQAGTPDAPEVEDARGDCAFPHGAGYLDMLGVWIERETASSFDVVIGLAAFDERVAEGAGYAVQFTHQGVRWGVIADFRPVSEDGWTFLTAQVDDEAADPETFRGAPGAFEPGEAPRVRVTFAKSLFPHTDPDDVVLRGFEAWSADLRTAYPFFLATDRAMPGSSNGRWLICDAAASDATYAFAQGAHAHASHEAPAAQVAQEVEAEDPPETTTSSPPDAPRATPVGGALAGLGCAAWLRLRRSAARP